MICLPLVPVTMRLWFNIGWFSGVSPINGSGIHLSIIESFSCRNDGQLITKCFKFQLAFFIFPLFSKTRILTESVLKNVRVVAGLPFRLNVFDFYSDINTRLMLCPVTALYPRLIQTMSSVKPKMTKRWKSFLFELNNTTADLKASIYLCQWIQHFCKKARCGWFTHDWERIKKTVLVFSRSG